MLCRCPSREGSPRRPPEKEAPRQAQAILRGLMAAPMVRLRHLPVHVGRVMFVRVRLIGGKGALHEKRHWESARSPIHLLHRAHQAVGQIFAMGMQPKDLAPRQLAVLVAVAENEGVGQTDLVKRTVVDRSTLADIVKRLKGKGLLARRRTKEDARAYAVKLTEEGQRVLRTAGPLAKRVDQRILDALSGKQRDQFVSALASIISTPERPAPAGT
jgi:MarR family transcriptional regulator, temperature-dependent positive regulator of motility